LDNPAEITYYLVSAPVATCWQEIVAVAGDRWMIESCFERAKAEVDLDCYEVRFWSSWYKLSSDIQLSY
jgi:SRSO17 transposase